MRRLGAIDRCLADWVQNNNDSIAEHGTVIAITLHTEHQFSTYVPSKKKLIFFVKTA
jgi:hypothetical protein